jgi:hypothetical protein
MNDLSSTSTLFGEVKALIEATQQRVALSVNAELTQLYWQIGTRINIELHQRGGTEYGRQTVRGLAQQLEAEYGRSYAEKSLRRMMQFAEVFAESAIVATVWRQLSWSHFKLLMAITEPLKRDFYTQLATLHR